MPELKNKRHEAFCLEYRKNGFNAKQAYKTVYKTKNDRTAESNGQKLLSYTEVQEFLEELSKKSQLRYGIDMERLVLRLKDLAYDDDKNASLKAVDMLIKVAGEYAPTKTDNTTKISGEIINWQETKNYGSKHKTD